MASSAMSARAVALALAGCVALSAGSAWCDSDPAQGRAGWHLAWSDEFDGPALDTSAWTAELGDGSPQNPGWGNAEGESYTDRPENLSIVPDGSSRVLRITARSERYGGRYYTSARIKTQGKRSMAFGLVEARIRLPSGRGLWPAFWMMGESITSAGWPACGEIDILEMRGGDDGTVLGTMHWRDASGGHAASIPGVARLPSGAFGDAYHVFGVEWSGTTLTWYLDGIPYVTQSLTEADREAFRGRPFFILLNLAVGGRFLSNQIPPIGFSSASMDVDWVRWYQKD
ncbi:MAG TPA: glycoside hydrolase family 16 protein [Spirochaetia bacterium]|nr:glycoside hydrolase family 16 protein [Spirochaetia bacterium]